MTEEITTDYFPVGSQREKIFLNIENKTAYEHMLEFINWSQPQAFNVVSGNDQFGNKAVKLVYLQNKGEIK